VNILFWNIKNNIKIVPLLPTLCVEKKVDILILSEIKDIDTTNYITRRLEETGQTYFSELPMPGNRTFLFHSLDKRIRKIKDGKHFSAYKISNGSVVVLLVSIHLPSKLHRSDNDIGHAGSLVKREIETIEKEIGTNKTIVVGDFNLNPFSELMVSIYGFHAIMCKKTASKSTRIVDGETHQYFYNPMWSLHGNDSSNVLGSYYHHKNPTSFVWNMFDQVIIRPSLIDNFNIKELELIHQIGEFSILKSSGAPNEREFSDHLPLKFNITLEG